MNKISILIVLALLLSSCNSRPYGTIELIGKNSGNDTIAVQGMGVVLDHTSIITSAHIVRNDQLRYSIQGVDYYIRERDTRGDRALLSRDKNSDIGFGILHGFPVEIDPGTAIYSKVIRSGSIVTLTGKVMVPDGSISGYDSLGRITTLSGILITDIGYMPGDSGAGVFDIDGRLIDVVHAK